ncbi:hypothetical protein DAI21_18040 [Lelliottia sp. WB101]|uniref:hypothetical protein n=1 Tax=Lelliottia sp. WB101 TaxID=2153385 RepID=UPI000D211369|nr:hypothetical protein [Lelliottia sp. WB101]AVY99415.1 hypothetical protein DAI21_18040 [Lelliottia sp. WB101]
MTEQTSFDIKFRLAYSYHLEYFTSVLLRRFDKFLLFIQFVLGSAVVTDRGPSFVYGVLVAVIAGLQFVIKPGEVAGAAKQQARHYSELLDDYIAEAIDTDTVRKKIKIIEKSDSDAPASLKAPAWNAAAISLDSEGRDATNLLGRFFIWLCGERCD